MGLDWGKWTAKSEKEQAEEGPISKWIGETFGHDGDGKGAGDFFYDLGHRDGGNDANQGAAAGVEITSEQANKAGNIFTDTAQVVGTAALDAYGLGSLADSINEAVDGVQVEANRSYLVKKLGASYVDKLDGLASWLAQYGWSQFDQCMALFSNSTVVTALKAKGINSKAIPGKFSAKMPYLYSLHPDLWYLKGAPSRSGYDSVLSKIQSAL